MAVQSGLILDENNLNYDGDGTLAGGKISISKAQKNNGISKAKNSNSLLASKQSKSSVRKIFGDLTNCEKPRSHQASKKAQECKKMDSIIMDDHHLQLKPFETEGTGGSCIEHEGFMHNHEECNKAKKRAEMMDMDYFLAEMIGMDYFLETGQDKSIKLVPAPLMSYESDDDEWTMIPNSPISQPKSPNYSTEEYDEYDKFFDLEWESPDFDLEWVDFKLKGSVSLKALID